MRRFLISALALFAFTLAALPDDPAKPPELPKVEPKATAKNPRKTGAKPTPGHKLASAPKFTAPAAEAVPVQIAYVPKQLDMWGNDQYGDCVSAEEAFAKACYQPEIFISTSEVVRWATAGGYRDGANLTPVMDSMARSGFRGAGNQLYNDGGYASVDYSTQSVLQAAIAQGPVKIGIDSNALPQGAGNDQGWHATGGRPGQFGNEDHCVALAGYGPTKWLYEQLGVALPAGLPTNGYLLYTWSTIGFVDHAWIMSTVGEAWVRNPTTIGVPPLTPPTPPPGPTPGPTPSGATITLSSDLPAGTYYLGKTPPLTPEQVQALADIMATLQPKSRQTPVNPGPVPLSLEEKLLLREFRKYLDERRQNP